MSDLPTEAEPNVLDTTAAGGLIIRGGVLRLGSYIGVVGLSILSAALLTRYLAPTGFSQYTTVLSLVGLIAIVTDAGMSNLAVREFSVGEGPERDALMRDLLGLRLALTTLGVVLVTAFAVAAGYSTALLGGTVVAGLATIALVLQHTLTIPVSAELRLGALSLLELARQALTMIAIVALIVLGAGVFPLLAVTLVVFVVLIPVTARLARGRISLRMELRPRRWRSLLASLWPEIADVANIRVHGTEAQGHLLAGWLRSRLDHDLALEVEERELLEGIDLDGVPAPFPPGNPPDASDVLSAQLDRFTRDPVYEGAVRAAGV